MFWIASWQSSPAITNALAAVLAAYSSAGTKLKEKSANASRKEDPLETAAQLVATLPASQSDDKPSLSDRADQLQASNTCSLRELGFHEQVSSPAQQH